MITIRVVALAGLLSLTFPALAQNLVTKNEDFSNDLGKLDLSAGISRQQADVIAKYYCHLHVAGCGSVSLAMNGGADWKVPVKTGVAAAGHADPIHIGKHTGKVSWGNGPSIVIADMLRSLRPAPKPLNARLESLDSDDLVSAIKIQFSVLRSGSTANHIFLRSSGNMKCDQSARRAVEGWSFAPGKEEITLVASLRACIAVDARTRHAR
nr:TonB family protein [uncultured Pseudoxanthomonas sp.]